MKKQITARVDMFLQVRSVIREFETEWTQMEAFGSTINRFETELDTLILLSKQQDTITVGVSLAKDILLKKVIERTISMANILSAYAATVEDQQLQLLVRVKKSHIDRSKKSIKINLIERIIKTANEHVQGLAPFGVTQTTIDELNAIKDNLNAAMLTPRKAIIDRKSVTLSIQEKAQIVFSIVRECIDPLVYSMKLDHPEFYKKYVAARTVIEVIHHRNDTDIIPPEKDDGKDPLEGIEDVA